MKQSALPVLSYATGAGWCILGYAANLASAAKIASNALSDASKSLIANYGFRLAVQRRTALQLELNGGPDGYIFDVTKTINPKGYHLKVVF